jgi:ribonuclease BN (tRNA processing enzyme)
VLIHDAQYLDEHYWGQLEGFPSTQGYGHSTVTMACEVAASASTGKLVLFHHDPSYTDNMLAGMEQTAKNLFRESIAAYEGLEIVLRSPSPLPLYHGEKGMEAVKYAQNG